MWTKGLTLINIQSRSLYTHFTILCAKCKAFTLAEMCQKFCKANLQGFVLQHETNMQLYK